MKIIDAHHHYWDPLVNNHPWLREEPMIPFRYGDYSSIRNRFMPPEYDSVSAHWNIVATVTMEGEWDPSDPTGEARWMQTLANETGRPAAHVAQAWLDHPSLADTLAVYRTLPIVKSIRHKPRSNPEPGGPPGGMTESKYREGFKRVADTGLMFDLQTPWWHLHEAAQMAALSPETPIILNHAGLPADRSAEGLAGWRDALTEFAELPQAYIKISGLGLAGRPWQLLDNIDIIRICIDTFSADRAMFASNFPVDGLCGSFDTIYSGFQAVTANDPAPSRDALFYRTAEKLYKIKS